MKKAPFFIMYFLAITITLINTFYTVKGSVFSDINDLPNGELLYSAKSPDRSCRINIYRIKNNIGVAVRGELQVNNKTKNVFWQTDIDDVETVWENKRVVNINGVSIDVIGGGYYDCRRGVSLFQEGAIEGVSENE